MVIQCKNLISLYILPDQGRVNLLVSNRNKYPPKKTLNPAKVQIFEIYKFVTYLEILDC